MYLEALKWALHLTDADITPKAFSETPQPVSANHAEVK